MFCVYLVVILYAWLHYTALQWSDFNISIISHQPTHCNCNDIHRHNSISLLANPHPLYCQSDIMAAINLTARWLVLCTKATLHLLRALIFIFILLDSQSYSIIIERAPVPPPPPPPVSCSPGDLWLTVYLGKLYVTYKGNTALLRSWNNVIDVDSTS